MKYLLMACLFIIAGCGGTLSDEQRRKLKEGMELQTIRKVSDAQLTEAAYALGRKITATLESRVNDRRLLDSVEVAYHVRILVLHPGDSLLLNIEQQIVEAYTASPDSALRSDNIQNLGGDTLLYTRPVMKTLPDGSMVFDRAIGIHLPRRQVVLSIPE